MDTLILEFVPISKMQASYMHFWFHPCGNIAAGDGPIEKLEAFHKNFIRLYTIKT